MRSQSSASSRSSPHGSSRRARVRGPRQRRRRARPRHPPSGCPAAPRLRAPGGGGARRRPSRRAAPALAVRSQRAPVGRSMDQGSSDTSHVRCGGIAIQARSLWVAGAHAARGESPRRRDRSIRSVRSNRAAARAEPAARIAGVVARSGVVAVRLRPDDRDRDPRRVPHRRSPPVVAEPRHRCLPVDGRSSNRDVELHHLVGQRACRGSRQDRAHGRADGLLPLALPTLVGTRTPHRCTGARGDGLHHIELRCRPFVSAHPAARHRAANVEFSFRSHGGRSRVLRRARDHRLLAHAPSLGARARGVRSDRDPAHRRRVAALPRHASPDRRRRRRDRRRARAPDHVGRCRARRSDWTNVDVGTTSSPIVQRGQLA